MATSGSYNYNITRDELVLKAFQKINVYSLDDTTSSISSEDLSYGVTMLNLLVKSWQAEGIKLWKRKLAYLFTELNEASYQLGSVSGADHCTTSYVSTTLSAAASSGASTVALTSVT